MEGGFGVDGSFEDFGASEGIEAFLRFFGAGAMEKDNASLFHGTNSVVPTNRSHGKR